MGTTDTALQTQQGVQIGFALLIEGYPYILTDAGTVNEVVNAYSGTGWTQALPWLSVIGSIKQAIEPFKEELDIPTLTFHVMDTDGSDTFGIHMWRSKGAVFSRQNAVFQPAADGSGTITVRSNDDFEASGTVYVGAQAVDYSAKDGSTGFTVPAAGAGAYMPFSADGSNIYSRPQNLADGQNYDVAAPPKISDVPPTWIDRHVALYIHRIRGGVWDTRAQAHLEFAGTIAKVEDGEGVTVVTCHDLRKKIEDTVILRRQWEGRVSDGIRLLTGDELRLREFPSGASPTTSGSFTVVASGASGSDEADEGLYEMDDFISRLSRGAGD